MRVCDIKQCYMQVVGIYMERSIEYVVAYIAALKAGAAYAVMETAYAPVIYHRRMDSCSFTATTNHK